MILRLVRDDEGDNVEQTALPVGATLLSGQYTITSMLESGGFGMTYLATDSLRRTVVIKECYPASMCCRDGYTVHATSAAEQGTFRKIVELFMQEAQNQASVNHPNIAGVHQVFKDNNTAYMALDYIDGKDLLAVMGETWPLPPKSVTHWLQKCLSAIAVVHDKGMLHRDLAPDNILINAEDQPILIDFGAARERASEESQGALLVRAVKDGYSPPEFYEQGSEQYLSSDLYSLAATFYHIITGKSPDPSWTRVQSVNDSKGDTYVPLSGRISGYPDVVLRTIDKALSVSPQNRFPNAQAWLDEMTVPAAAPSAPSRQEKDAPPKPKRNLWLVAAMVMVAIGGAGGYFAFNSASGAKQVEAGAQPIVETPAPIRVAGDTVGDLVIDLPFEMTSSEQPEGTFAQITALRSDVPGSAQDWLQSGTIIYTVNGHIVGGQDSVKEQLLIAAAEAGGTPFVANFRVKPFGSNTAGDRTLLISPGYEIVLDNGLAFVTTKQADSTWTTRVSRAPANADLELGDTLLSEVQSGIVLSDQDAILQVRAALGGNAGFFTVSRNGVQEAVAVNLN